MVFHLDTTLHLDLAPGRSLERLQHELASARGTRSISEHLRRKAGNITHSVALINACKPFHWKDEFPPSNTPSPEIAKKAREKFGWLLNGKEPG